MTMKLEPHIMARHLLPDATRESMFALHNRYFCNVRRERFMADLDDKDWVILLRVRNGGVAGFSTQKIIQPIPATGSARFIFSGDTIVDRAHWNTPLLACCFAHLLQRMITRYGEDDLYWFLISKGFRTYRIMSIFFDQYWPAPGRDMPPDIAALLTAAAAHRFGTAFDPLTGIVSSPEADRLAPAVAEIPHARMRDPRVAYFLARNPGYAQGDELACIAPVRQDNLNAYARRVIRDTTPVWLC